MESERRWTAVFNKVILIGRLCSDPELRQTANGTACCRFRIAVNRPYRKDAEKQESDFITVSCWRKTAEFVSRYFSKGKAILIEGALRNNDFEDKNGVKHYSYEVLAENVSFAESKSESGSESARPQTEQRSPLEQPSAKELESLTGYEEEVLSDGEVPF